MNPVKFFLKISYFLKLYRLDAAVITFFSLLFGAYLSTQQISTHYLLVSFLVSGISINFIYSINSWFDRDIDAVNKPHRVLPKGLLSSKECFVYLSILFFVSIVYPFFLSVSYSTILLFWIFPLLGVLYSNPWLPLKKKPVLAVLVTALILILPMLLGQVVYGQVSMPNANITALLFMYCLCTIPLKDIEDIKGDVMYKSGNWSAIIGTNRLVTFCLIAQIVLMCISFFLLPSPLNIYLSGLSLVSSFVILSFMLFRWSFTKLYQSIIRMVILCGIVFFLITLGLNYA